MRRKRWNTVGLALVGFALGAGVGLFRATSAAPAVENTMGGDIGEVAGFAIGAALIFAVASGVRNGWFRR